MSKDTAVTNNTDNVYNEDICNIIKLFEEASVKVIGTMNMTNVRNRTFDTTDSVSHVTNGKKNFKKFVKVPPKRPQKIIISTADFIANVANDTLGISVNQMNFQDEEDAENRRPKQNSKNPFKKFRLK